MIRLLIQNIIERSKRLQLLFLMLIYKAMKRPEYGSEMAEQKKLSSRRTLGKQNEAATDFHHCN
jgi:hypothetical protein